MRHVVLAATLAILASAAGSSARAQGREDGASLSAPDPRARRAPRAPRAVAAPWRGPRVELGFAHAFVADPHGGDVDLGTFGGYVPLDRLRLGAMAAAGTRHFAPAADDAFLSATLIVGYQHTPRVGPFVPHVAALGTLGVTFGQRFHTRYADLVRGVGIELGTSVLLVEPLFFGLAFSYQRMTVDDLAYDYVTLRMTLGL